MGVCLSQLSLNKSKKNNSAKEQEEERLFYFILFYELYHLIDFQLNFTKSVRQIINYRFHTKKSLF